MASVAIARAIHRRWDTSYALLTVGVITYTVALIVQYVALEALGGGLMNILATRGASRRAGRVQRDRARLSASSIWRGERSAGAALMIGLGHGIVETFYTGIVGLGLGVSMLGYGAAPPEDPGALIGGALAELVGGVLVLALHMALSWLVLQVFLRGQIGWLFVAIGLHAASEIMIVLLGPDAGWAAALWRGVIALISMGIILYVRQPVPQESA